MNQPWLPILDFWFLPAGHAMHLRSRPEWFQKNAELDRAIQDRFGVLVQDAVAGGLQAWEAEPQGALARLLLLDQFTRNIWRGTAQAFAGDAQAVETALKLIEQGADQGMAVVQRQFVYMPLMHAEDLALQEQCVVLFQALAAQDPSQNGGLDFAIRHRDIVARFGRFPHRNQQLGRPSTPQEAVFLTEPNSGF